MNKQPIYYMQTDNRWKNTDYSASGEKTTIGKAGCGPTCAAMLIQTITGKEYTPEDACRYSLEHGYKAKNQGTYYSYFVPQFAKFGIQCDRLNWSNLYGKKDSLVHNAAFARLEQGYYLIACMGKGTWTSSGHFVVVWWEDGKVRINDPYSKSTKRIEGDIDTFKSQVKYYWAVDARGYNAKAAFYFPAYTGKSGSITDALKAIGEKSTYAYRKQIAKANGILNYSGTAGQNSSMLAMLKLGVLIKP